MGPKRRPERTTPREVADSERFRVLDVREHDEWHAGGIPGALHIPLAELPARLAELDRTHPVAVVCRSGRRSAAAARFLADAGFEAANLEGGMQAWQREGLPVRTPDGTPGTVR